MGEPIDLDCRSIGVLLILIIVAIAVALIVLGVGGNIVPPP